MVKIKISLEEYLKKGKPLKLDIGCGLKKSEGYIGIDSLDLPNVDIVADLNEGFPFLPDESVEEIRAKSVLEHVYNLDVLMREAWRVLKKGGKFWIFVPHFANPYFYSDPSHVRFFGLYSFHYFSRNNLYKRKVPKWYYSYSFKIEYQRYIFYSPFRIINLIKKIIQKIVNSSHSFQAIYEDLFIYVLPPYAMEVLLVKE